MTEALLQDASGGVAASSGQASRELPDRPPALVATDENDEMFENGEDAALDADDVPGGGAAAAAHAGLAVLGALASPRSQKVVQDVAEPMSSQLSPRQKAKSAKDLLKKLNRQGSASYSAMLARIKDSPDPDISTHF